MRKKRNKRPGRLALKKGDTMTDDGSQGSLSRFSSSSSEKSNFSVSKVDKQLKTSLTSLQSVKDPPKSPGKVVSGSPFHGNNKVQLREIASQGTKKAKTSKSGHDSKLSDESILWKTLCYSYFC